MRNRKIMKTGILTLSLLIAVALCGYAQTVGEGKYTGQDVQKVEKKKFKIKNSDEQRPERLKKRFQRRERVRLDEASEPSGCTCGARVGRKCDREGIQQRNRAGTGKRNRAAMQQGDRADGKHRNRGDMRGQRRHRNEWAMEHPKAAKAIKERRHGRDSGNDYKRPLKRQRLCEYCRKQLKNRKYADDRPIKQRAQRARERGKEKAEDQLRRRRGGPRKREAKPETRETNIEVRKREVTRITREVES